MACAAKHPRLQVSEPPKKKTRGHEQTPSRSAPPLSVTCMYATRLSYEMVRRRGTSASRELMLGAAALDARWRGDDIPREGLPPPPWWLARRACSAAMAPAPLTRQTIAPPSSARSQSALASAGGNSLKHFTAHSSSPCGTLTRRARNASGTATQCTRRNGSPAAGRRARRGRGPTASGGRPTPRPQRRPAAPHSANVASGGSSNRRHAMVVHTRHGTAPHTRARCFTADAPPWADLIERARRGRRVRAPQLAGWRPEPWLEAGHRAARHAMHRHHLLLGPRPRRHSVADGGDGSVQLPREALARDGEQPWAAASRPPSAQSPLNLGAAPVHLSKHG
jgi:hypothetical protein